MEIGDQGRSRGRELRVGLNAKNRTINKPKVCPVHQGTRVCLMGDPKDTHIPSYGAGHQPAGTIQELNIELRDMHLPPPSMIGAAWRGVRGLCVWGVAL